MSCKPKTLSVFCMFLLLLRFTFIGPSRPSVTCVHIKFENINITIPKHNCFFTWYQPKLLSSTETAQGEKELCAEPLPFARGRESEREVLLAYHSFRWEDEEWKTTPRRNTRVKPQWNHTMPSSLLVVVVGLHSASNLTLIYFPCAYDIKCEPFPHRSTVFLFHSIKYSFTNFNV